MAGDEDLNEAAAKHIRELDEHLERLKRQNDALDALAEEQSIEVEQLKRLLAEAADHLRPGPGKEPPGR